MSNLEAWQKRYQSTWFEIIKMGPPAIDGLLQNEARSKPKDVDQPAREALRFRRTFHESQSIILAEKTLESLEKMAISFCKSEIAVDRKEGKYYIIDIVSQDTVKLKDALELASRLRDSNPFTFGTLKCKDKINSVSSTIGQISDLTTDFMPNPSSNMAVIQSMLTTPIEETEVRLSQELSEAMYAKTDNGQFVNTTG
ncbi:hypothetical protein ACHAO9_012016 [Fusarium lateritium]